MLTEFLSFMSLNGFSPESQIEIGKFTRFHVTGDKPGSKNGACILHQGEHAWHGHFGSWKTDEWHTWCSVLQTKVSKPVWRKIQSELEARRREFEKDQDDAYRAAAEIAKRIWTSLKAPNQDHPYLKRKQIQPGPARQDGQNLVLKVCQNSEIVGLQYIAPEGQKWFLTGTRLKGSFIPIGSPQKESSQHTKEVVYICEGFATGMSIHMATGAFVVCSINAGNMQNVHNYAKSRMPEATIIIAADNDSANTGLNAAQKCRGVIAMPTLKDFNDVYVALGAEEVKKQLDPQPNFPVPVEQSLQTIQWKHVRISTSGKILGPKTTIETMLQLLMAVGVVARYNVIKKDSEIFIPQHDYCLDTAKNDALNQIVSIAVIADLPTQHVINFVETIAAQNQYNPVMRWVESKAWDGISRLQAFYDTIECEGEYQTKLKELFMKRWLVSAIAAACRPDGLAAQGVLVLQGAQGIGKTTWAQRLVPDDLDVVAVGRTLQPSHPDSVASAIRHWIVELGELDATFKKADIAQLKSFLTNRIDVIRMPYDRRAGSYARRTVFFASVNDDEFLQDKTGNRRFWTVRCKSIDHQHCIAMQQVWAEVYELYKNGEKHFLNDQELSELRVHNESFEAQDPVEQLIAENLDWDKPKLLWSFEATTNTLKRLKAPRIGMYEIKRAASAIRKLNGNVERRGHGNTLLLHTPPLKTRYLDENNSYLE